MVSIRKATPNDARLLTQIQSLTFEDDNARKPEECSKQGPPGCDSIAWNEQMIKNVDYFVVEYDEVIVGGIIVFKKSKSHFELGRIFIHPEYQNKGIGGTAMRDIFDVFSHDALWTTGTPEWAVSNHKFYESLGFRKIGETDFDPDLGWVGFIYQKS